MPKREFKIRPSSLDGLGYFLVKVYESNKQLNRYSGLQNEILGFCEENMKGKRIGIIGISQESTKSTILHEAFHACMIVARNAGILKEMGWARAYWEAREEEEFLAGLMEEITEEIREQLESHG